MCGELNSNSCRALITIVGVIWARSKGNPNEFLGSFGEPPATRSSDRIVGGDFERTNTKAATLPQTQKEKDDAGFDYCCSC